MCLCSGLFDVLESALFGFRPYLRDVSSCVDHPHIHTHIERQQTDNMTINGVELAGEKSRAFAIPPSTSYTRLTCGSEI